MPSSPDARVMRIAARQHGVFSRAQALDAGLSPKMVRGRVELGLWVPLHLGVFVLAGAPRTVEATAMAGCLAAGGAAARRTAARLWGFPAPEAPAVEILTRHGVRSRRPGIRCYQATTVLPGDIVALGAIPVTSPARTLLDLAACLEAPQLERALDDALARQLVTLARLERRLDRQSLAGCPGVGTLRTLVAAYAPPAAGSRSHLAQSFVRLFRRLGLPEPVVELPVRLLDGRTIHADLGYPDRRVAIEIQTRRWHTGRARTEADLARENELELVGYRLLHLTSGDLRRPPTVRRLVLGAIESIQAP